MTKSYFAWVVVVNKKDPPVFPENDACDAGVVPRRPSRPPRMASATARWDLDATLDGSGNLDTEIYPAGGTRECAINWWVRHAPEFKKQGIKSRMLIAFVDGIVTPADRQLRAAEEWPRFPHQFQDSEWTGDFKTKDERGDTSLLPANWKAFEGLSLPVPSANECSVLREYKLKLRKVQEDQITWEAKSWRNAIDEVLRLVGDLTYPTLCTHTLELLRRLDGSIDAPLFTLKKRFMRGRPAKEEGCVDGMFPPPHPYHPGHPAYPSGHATMAHAAALVLQEVDSTLDPQKLDEAASDIAQRREIAGLHYPSDSEAGRRLAHWLVDQLKQSSEFVQLMKLARDELIAYHAGRL